MGRCAAVGLLLVASGCAAVAGLGDYEVVPDDAASSSGADGGPMTTPSDACFCLDQAVLTQSDGETVVDGSPEDGSLDATTDAPTDGAVSPLPTCARTDCSGVPNCSAEPCGATKVWNQNGSEEAIERTNNVCHVKKQNAFVEQSAAVSGTSPSFELGFHIAFSGAPDATIAQIAIGGKKATVSVVSTKLSICGTNCNSTILPAVPSALDIDVYGVFANGAWVVYLSTGTNQCPGTLLTKLNDATISSVDAQVGCIDSPTDSCVFGLDHLTFSVRSP